MSSTYEPDVLDNPLLGLFFGTETIGETTPMVTNQPIRVMHAPSHVGEFVEQECQSIKKLSPDIVGRTEMDPGQHSNVPVMRRVMDNYKILAMDKGEHSQEVPIGVKNEPHMRVDSAQTYRLSRSLPGGGIGEDRWMNLVLFTYHGAPMFHAATHWNAALQDRVTGAIHTGPRVRAMEGAFHTMYNVLEKVKREREGFITGDFNYRKPRLASLWEFSPQALFTALHMKWFEDGLDYLAWSKGLKETSPVRVISAGTMLNRSDHPWLIGHFVGKDMHHA
jgi:hypothetical protein